MKIVQITPIYKGGGKENIANYRTIFALPCFSKILERIMYNKKTAFIFDWKQFGL